MSQFSGFPAGCIPFLNDLRRNNERAWFEANKANYETAVREPALAFIEAMAAELPSISPHFRAVAKKTGGSLMRVHRDIRFARDKTPYKTNVGIQFRHRAGKDVHAPGFYLHIEPGRCFIGAGIWRPDSKNLARLRDFIVDNPASWKAAKNHKPFKTRFQLEGESLKRPPRAYPADHPLIEDLKRKDFIALCAFDEGEIENPRFCRFVAARFGHAAPFMDYLCTALALEY